MKREKNKHPMYSLSLANLLMKAYSEPSFNPGIKNASEPFNTRSCIT